MKAPDWIRTFQKHQHWFRASQKILETLKDARHGGPVATTLAGLSIFGQVVDTMFPGESGWQILRQRGYRDTNFSIGGFLCEIMMQSDLPAIVLPVGLSSQVVMWETEDAGVAAVYHGGEYGDGPFLRDGDEAAFVALLQRIIWENGNDLMLSANKGYFWRGARKFRLTPMPEPGPYIGKKQPEDFAARIAKYGDTPRTVLLRGPTGIGKSVLARHIAKVMGKGSTRTLKIAASILKACRFDEVIALARFFQPSVLLLDDLDLSDKSNTEEFLTMLEALRAPDCLVIVTMMAPTERDKEPEMGDWHFDGMRPGRIDEIFTFYLPDAEEREAILRHYFDTFGMVVPKKATLKKIVEATEELSGAYLSEVARRIHVHGLEEWEGEILNVRRTAPKPGKAEEEKGNGDNPPDSGDKCKDAHPS